MEEKIIERSPMSNEEFEDYLKSNGRLTTYIGVSKYKSISRAIRRGLVAPNGMLIPKRPFSNKANTSSRKGVHSRKMNELKKSIYYGIKQSGEA